MNNLLEGQIDKNALKKIVRDQILLHKPDLHHRATDHTIGQAVHFAEGYLKCFRDLVHHPFNSIKETNDFLLSEIVNYAVKLLTRGI